jgi:endonuclease III
VVDSYTRRIFERHELVDADADYDELRLAVEQALADGRGGPHPDHNAAKAKTAKDKDKVGIDALGIDARREAGPPPTHLPSVASAMERSEMSRRYNEFHALLVQTAKHYCVKGTPKCENCPLRSLLPPSHGSR